VRKGTLMGTWRDIIGYFKVDGAERHSMRYTFNKKIDIADYIQRECEQFVYRKYTGFLYPTQYETPVFAFYLRNSDDAENLYDLLCDKLNSNSRKRLLGSNNWSDFPRYMTVRYTNNDTFDLMRTTSCDRISGYQNEVPGQHIVLDYLSSGFMVDL
jgi:hypothetical protein